MNPEIEERLAQEIKYTKIKLVKIHNRSLVVITALMTIMISITVICLFDKSWFAAGVSSIFVGLMAFQITMDCRWFEEIILKF